MDFRIVQKSSLDFSGTLVSTSIIGWGQWIASRRDNNLKHGDFRWYHISRATFFPFRPAPNWQVALSYSLLRDAPFYIVHVRFIITGVVVFPNSNVRQEPISKMNAIWYSKKVLWFPFQIASFISLLCFFLFKGL